jgi:hypothetical protein
MRCGGGSNPSHTPRGQRTTLVYDIIAEIDIDFGFEDEFFRQVTNPDNRRYLHENRVRPDCGATFQASKAAEYPLSRQSFGPAMGVYVSALARTVLRRSGALRSSDSSTRSSLR